MINTFVTAEKEIGYRPTVFLSMITERGSLVTAKQLINSPLESYGYKKLRSNGRLDLSVEAIVVDNPEYHPLFTPKEIELAKTKLIHDGYQPKPAVLLAVPEGESAEAIGSTTATARKGKYGWFAVWLLNQSADTIPITFREIEEILGFQLPESARHYNAYWSGGQPGGTIGNVITDAGWRATQVDVRGERTTLVRRRVPREV